jgi:ribonuclease HI/probable phosphoglycerate mutase
MELILIRHGESEKNVDTNARTDSELTPLGWKQAEAAGEALRDAGIERLYCSLQHRALQTASVLAKHMQLRPVGWLELCERGFSPQENGLPRSAIQSSYPLIDLPDEADEEGWARHWHEESLDKLAIRMGGVAQRFRELAAGGEITRMACVIHGTSCSMMLRKLFGVADESDASFSHHNCGITVIKFSETKTLLHKLNDTRHLKGLSRTGEA